MTVALGDAAVPIADAQARFLVAAHLPTLVDRLSLDVPAAARVRHHMMGVCSTPSAFRMSELIISLLRTFMGMDMRVVKD
jgi:hypothetical protein